MTSSDCYNVLGCHFRYNGCSSYSFHKFQAWNLASTKIRQTDRQIHFLCLPRIMVHTNDKFRLYLQSLKKKFEKQCIVSHVQILVWIQRKEFWNKKKRILHKADPFYLSKDFPNSRSDVERYFCFFFTFLTSTFTSFMLNDSISRSFSIIVMGCLRCRQSSNRPFKNRS